MTLVSFVQKSLVPITTCFSDSGDVSRQDRTPGKCVKCPHRFSVYVQLFVGFLISEHEGDLVGLVSSAKSLKNQVGTAQGPPWTYLSTLNGYQLGLHFCVSV